MTPVAPGNSTVSFMRKKIRRLTASSSESALTTSSLDEYLNNALLNDFPYAIKIDQMRSIYTFYTEPYRDRYPLDVNFNQGIRAPLYVDGIQGSFFKDRTQFYNLWPRYPTLFNQGATTDSGVITNVDLTGLTNPLGTVRVVSFAHGLNSGDVVTINDVLGSTELNGNSYQITLTANQVNSYNLVGTSVVDYSPYISGGNWITSNRTFIFTLPGPFLSKEVTIGGLSTSGLPISINDDGNGNLQYMTVNPVIAVPTSQQQPSTVPGMYNLNTGNPGLINPTNIGTVNYVTGEFNFTLPIGISLAEGTLLTIRISQYQHGKPYCLLFWNNEFTIRPIPKKIHKIEIETYLSPVQFYNSTDVPILNQWAQYLAYIAAMEILRDRNDFEGVEGLREGFNRQEALVLERQGIEEIFQPTVQLFNSTQGYSIYNGYSGFGGY